LRRKDRIGHRQARFEPFHARPCHALTPLALQCGNVFDSKTARLVGERTIVMKDGVVHVGGSAR